MARADLSATEGDGSQEYQNDDGRYKSPIWRTEHRGRIDDYESEFAVQYPENFKKTPVPFLFQSLTCAVVTQECLRHSAHHSDCRTP